MWQAITIKSNRSTNVIEMYAKILFTLTSSKIYTARVKTKRSAQFQANPLTIFLYKFFVYVSLKSRRKPNEHMMDSNKSIGVSICSKMEMYVSKTRSRSNRPVQ